MEVSGARRAWLIWAVVCGYRDAADVAGEGLEPTWPQDEYRSPPVTIDHVLADRRIGFADYDVLDLPGSDHRAVFARLVLP